MLQLINTVNQCVKVKVNDALALVVIDGRYVREIKHRAFSNYHIEYVTHQGKQYQVNTVTATDKIDALFSLRYDHDGATRRYTIAVTNSSNYELYGVRHTRISNALGEALYAAIMRNELKVIQHYSDGMINHSIKSGAFQFYIGANEE